MQQNQCQKQGAEMEDSETKQKTAKRIVKVPLPDILKKKVKLNDETQLWKPKSLQQHKQDKKQQQLAKKGIQKVFNLPKPKNNEPLVQKNADYRRPKPKPLINLEAKTEDQIKWDIEDQTFIVKEFEKAPPNPNLKEQFRQENQEPQLQLPDDFKGHKITYLQKNQLLDPDWKHKEQQRKARLSVWQNAILPVSAADKSKNQINKLLEDAMKKSEQTDYEMTKRANDRKQMKNRYGW